MNLWTGLLANMALLMSVVCIWGNARPDLFPMSPLQRRAAFGLLCAGAVVVAMNMSVPFGSGIFMDLRNSIVTLAALFGGPVSVGIAVIGGAAYRLHLGGAGSYVGVLSMAASALVGLVGFHLSHKTRPNWELLAVVSLNASIFAVLTFVLLPVAQVKVIFLYAGLPMIVLNTVSAFVCGLAMLNELRRRDLAHVNHIYRMAIDAFPDCLNVKDTEGRFLIANDATAKLMQASDAAGLIGKTDADFYPPDVASRVTDDEHTAITRRTPTQIEQKVVHSNGKVIWLSTLKVPLFDEAGTLTALITHNRDISDSRLLATELATSRQHLEDVILNMPGGVAMFDPQGVLIFCNQKYREMFPLTADLRIPGSSYRDILHGALQRGEFMAVPATLQADLKKAPQDLLLSRDKTQSQLSDGHWVETHVRFTVGGACFFLCNDITRLKAKEAKLVELNAKLSLAAVTDALTGLANRRAFDEYLKHELKRSSRGSLPLSLILIDVDRFKAYNDIYGHPAGDECLKIVAQCVEEAGRRPSDMAARYGGEEMALILPLTSEEQALHIAQALQSQLRERTIPHEGSEMGIVTVSIGVTALEPGDPTDITPLEFVRRADEGLYKAKGAGRDTIRVASSAAGKSKVRA
jgi:diguanylate cyclase (GGDEF)-like protein/PAS domain S-box-containing protein